MSQTPMMMKNVGVTREQVTAALPKLEQLVKETMDKTGVPGMAITVVFQDEVLYLRGFGTRKVGEHQLVDADTVFQIASMSKPIASTVMAKLASEEVIDWDDPVIKHDPGFQLYDTYVTHEVTLRDMFCHRSGLPEYAGDFMEDLEYSREEILSSLRYQTPGSSFRSTYAYTNFGLTEAGVAAARAVGKAWEDLAHDTLYQPLGMQSTSSRYTDYLGRQNRAFGHVLEGGKWDEHGRLAAGKWVAKYQRDPDTEAPAGGVSSCVRDLAQWLRLQLNNGTYSGQQVIVAKALAETHRPQIVRQPPSNPSTDIGGFYGLGWNVDYDNQGHVKLSHSGAFALGASTDVNMLPGERLGIIALTNGFPIGVPEAITASFLDLALYGERRKDWYTLYQQAFAAMMQAFYGSGTDYSRPPAQALPPLPLDSYAGTYTNDYFGDIHVLTQGGGLVLQEGPKRLEFPLTPYDRDVFIYQPVGESAGGLSGVMFRAEPNLKGYLQVLGVLIENLNSNGNGIFTRVPDKQ